MKGLCADRAEKHYPVGILYTHSLLRRDGALHGFLATDKGYVSFRFIPPRLGLINVSCSRQVARHTATGFSRVRHGRSVVD
jgi:hypothetical protein